MNIRKLFQNNHGTFKVRVTRHGHKGRSVYIRHSRQEARELAKKYRHQGRAVAMFEMKVDGDWEVVEG